MLISPGSSRCVRSRSLGQAPPSPGKFALQAQKFSQKRLNLLARSLHPLAYSGIVRYWTAALLTPPHSGTCPLNIPRGKSGELPFAIVVTLPSPSPSSLLEFCCSVLPTELCPGPNKAAWREQPLLALTAGPPCHCCYAGRGHPDSWCIMMSRVPSPLHHPDIVRFCFVSTQLCLLEASCFLPSNRGSRFRVAQEPTF